MFSFSLHPRTGALQRAARKARCNQVNHVPKPSNTSPTRASTHSCGVPSSFRANRWMTTPVHLSARSLSGMGRSSRRAATTRSPPRPDRTRRDRRDPPSLRSRRQPVPERLRDLLQFRTLPDVPWRYSLGGHRQGPLRERPYHGGSGRLRRRAPVSGDRFAGRGPRLAHGSATGRRGEGSLQCVAGPNRHGWSRLGVIITLPT